VFGDLPKIFDRNFVVGYVLPSALFLLLSLGFTHKATCVSPNYLGRRVIRGSGFRFRDNTLAIQPHRHTHLGRLREIKSRQTHEVVPVLAVPTAR